MRTYIARAAVVGAVVCGALAWLPLFGWWGLLLPLAVAIVLPWAIASLGRHRSWPALGVMGASVLAFLVAAALTVHFDTTAGGLPTVDTLVSVTLGLGDGIEQILTSPSPAYPEPAMVFVPFAVVWWTTQASAMLVSAGRFRLALLPPLAAWLAGVVASLGMGSVTLVSSAGLALAILVVLTSSTLQAAKLAAGRTVVLIACLTAATLLVCLSLGPLTQPWDPRSIVSPPVDSTPVTDPLQQVQAWNADPAAVEVSVDFHGSSQPLVLSILEDYDGRTWNVGSGYLRAGQDLPAPPAEQPAAESSTADITVGQLDGAEWVPVIDRPTTVSDGQWLVNTPTGMLRRVAAGSGDSMPYSYTVTGAAPNLAVSDNSTGSAGTGIEGAGERTTQLPANLPDSVTMLAADATAGAQGSTAKAQALAEYLRNNYSNDPAVPSGSSLGQVRAFLEDTSVSNRHGFVAAYALLARIVQLPSRIVIQFNDPGADAALDGADVVAVPQVWLGPAVGWQMFDPVPEEGETPRNAPQGASELQTPDVPEVIPPQAERCDGACYEEPPTSLPLWLRLTMGLVALSLLATLGHLAAIRVGKRRRLRRRLAGPPRVSVRGAFAEAVDEYLDAGLLNPSPDLTDAELAGRLPAETGLVELARLADAAAFSPQAPGPQMVTYAWMLSDDVRGHLADELTPVVRLRQRFSPRSLRFRARLSRARRSSVATGSAREATAWPEPQLHEGLSEGTAK